MPVPVLTAAAMRQADETTIESFGIPGFTLMESAGRVAAEVVSEVLEFVDGNAVLILCGKGNNGGDGLVVARQLGQFGYSVDVVIMGGRDSLSDDAGANFDLVEKLVDHDDDVDVQIVEFEEWNREGRPGDWDVVVDALLGTGLTQELRDPIAGLVDWINESDAAVVAIDMPTGLDTDRGVPLGNCVEADVTVTMGALKVGLVVNDGPDFAGRIEVAEIGIPDFALADAAREAGCAWIADDQDVALWLPDRDRRAHKYSAGMVLAAVGSQKYTGAAVMSTVAALRAGAGYVVAGVPAAIKDSLAEHLVEVALEPLPDTEGGSISRAALEVLSARLEKADSLLVGCGLGREDETLSFVRDLIAGSDIPGVLDADGLYALPGHFDVLKKEPEREWILTPHWGEFRHLVGDADLDPNDKVTLAARFASEWNCVLLLKGMPSVVGLPSGRVFINSTGNPALATAGTGDVLAGLCAGFLAQGLSPAQAAIAGLHVGGAAADLFAESGDPRTMIASDILDLIPETIADRF